MHYIEKCPKCGGKIMTIVLTSNPPINKKVCESCGSSWSKTEEVAQMVFNPEEQGYTEISKISNEVITNESTTSVN